MIEKSLDKLAEGGKAEFFSNINRCFTKREELLSLHEMILSNENYGTYNVGSKMTSYYDRVKNLCSELSISSDNLSSAIGEVNPIEQNMNMEKFTTLASQALSIATTIWRSALKTSDSTQGRKSNCNRHSPRRLRGW